jgi:hypothetical protein
MPIWRSIVIFLIAIGILGGFAVLVAYMLDNSGAKVVEKVWSRRLYIFGAVEAIAFTAVGWVFGREVHRSEAKTAKEQAAAAQKSVAAAQEAASAKAEEAATERTKGATLAHAVRASSVSAPESVEVD